jgi:hypothetical protein
MFSRKKKKLRKKARHGYRFSIDGKITDRDTFIAKLDAALLREGIEEELEDSLLSIIREGQVFVEETFDENDETKITVFKLE